MNTKLGFKEFCVNAEKLMQFAAKQKNAPVDKDFQNNLKLWSAGIFKIVVMGEIKKGKSSLINAILGVKDLLPTSSDVATSTVYKICYGPEIKYRVFFLEDSGKAPIFIGKDKIAEYGTEDGNPLNEKQVDFIQVLVPSPLLKNGLVIIDTPGLGGMFKQHKKITYQYVPRADGVFLACDSIESPLGEAEISLLGDINKFTKNVCVVQTKSCSVDSKARLARKQNNLTILKNAGYGNLKYFVVDSLLRFEANESRDLEDLAASGFPELLAFVNNSIRANVQEFIRSKILVSFLPTIRSLSNEFAVRKNILNANTVKGQAQIKNDIEKANKELVDFIQNTQPEIQEIVQRGIVDIRETAEDYLGKLRPGGEFVLALESKVESVDTIDEMRSVIDIIQNKMQELIADSEFDIQRQINLKVEELTKLVSQKCSQFRANIKGDISQEKVFVKKIEDIDKVGLFDKLRNWSYGGIAGSLILANGGALVGSVFPVVGTVIGSALGVTVGTLWGVFEADKIKNKAVLKNAKQQTIAGVNKAMSVASLAIQKKMRHCLSDIEISITSALRKGISDAQNELARRKTELEMQSMRSAKEISMEKVKLGKEEAYFNNLVSVLTAQ